ncbi:hypothetical protein AQUCO_08000005v1 [Aquilegia coerulea]|uniref:Replication protein A 70 kDa DNA-binding subunit B/D first OB fold domain-containing protein n=1 Tax=Aquilegia coerulea TaxID=218851 RepID=A0A2G5C7S1_AQUCA|nr:hypothetical protein AQUCO_08000005v1 [Aquilegia coerulea]
MAEQNIKLSECKDKNSSWKVIVRVLEIWKDKDESNNQTTDMNMIIIDEDGTKMHTKINQKDIPTLEPKFQESKIYTIWRFSCW